MSPMQNGLKFTDRITKYLTKSAERKTTRASTSKGHVISKDDNNVDLSEILTSEQMFSLNQKQDVSSVLKNQQKPP